MRMPVSIACYAAVLMRPLATAVFLQSLALVFYELLLTRLFAVTLFADFAHLALALAMLGVGVGAVAQHLWPSFVPAEGLSRRVAWLGLLQGALTLAAVVAAIRFPVLRESESIPTTFQDRSHIKDDLLDPVWFIALLPVLALPFVVAGLTFAGVFERKKDDIGLLYAADLVGAGAGALLFLPALTALAGPDAAFVAAIACGVGAVVVGWAERDKPLLGAGLAGALFALVASIAALPGDLLTIRQAAGYSETQLVYTKWTPLVRLAIHRDKKRGDYMLLDNTSASEIVRTERQRDAIATNANRALVYALHDPPGRVAILAASAGPEVASAEAFGFTDIDAVDIASEIFEVVAERYPDAPANPYLVPGVNRVHADGRAAILRATEPYEVIQMVHANLWSSSGMLSNAWSPALLETNEAFTTYLDHLAEDGTISFGKGSQTPELYRAALAALRARGAAEPWRHIAYLGGDNRFILVKRHPWTSAERDRLLEVIAKKFPRNTVEIDPTAAQVPKLVAELSRGAAITDDHPYADSPDLIAKTARRAWSRAAGSGEEPLAALYRSIVVQVAFAFAAGLGFLGVPLLVRGRADLDAGAVPALAYVACLGYGYLAVETVLIHEIVLFVGHPTYAVTVVVLAMLASSGLGSWWAARPAAEDLPRVHLAMLGAIVIFGGLLAYVAIPSLYLFALHLSLGLRVAITGAVLTPLGFAMGTAFPIGIRRIDASHARIIPWAWAINAWMSVVGSLATVLVARLWGFTPAFALALLVYAVAAALAPRIR